MSIGVILGIKVKKLPPISPKSAASILPACVAALLSAMVAPATHSAADVRSANTIAGISGLRTMELEGYFGYCDECRKSEFYKSVQKTELANSSRQTNRGRHRARGRQCELQSGAPTGTGCSHLSVGHSENRSARFTVADAVAYAPRQKWGSASTKAAPTTPPKYGPVPVKAPPSSPPRYGPTPTKSGPTQHPQGVYVQQGFNEPSSSGLRGPTAEAGARYDGPPPPPPSGPPPKTKAAPPTLSQQEKSSYGV